MANYGIFGILILALAPFVFIAVIQIVKQSFQQKKLMKCRANLIAKRESAPSKTRSAFFPEHICMIENMSKLKQRNEGPSPYSIWWSSFRVKDFSTNCKMTTSERGLR